MVLQKKISDFMTKEGYLVLKIIRLNKNGYPDLLCIKENQKNIWIEIKEKNDNLKPLQMERINELNKIGNIAICLKCENVIYPFKEQFDQWYKKTKII